MFSPLLFAWCLPWTIPATTGLALLGPFMGVIIPRPRSLEPDGTEVPDFGRAPARAVKGRAIRALPAPRE